MAASSDGYLFFRTVVGSDLTTQLALASGATGSTSVLSARNSASHINVQVIRIIPTTYGVGSVTFRETDSTGALIGVITQQGADATGSNAYGPQAHTLDFGAKGWKLTAGAPVFMVRSSATGPGGNLVIEAYGTLSTGPVAILTSN